MSDTPAVPAWILHQLVDGSWLAACTICGTYTTRCRTSKEEATAHANRHWRVWHTTREDRQWGEQQ